MHTQIADRCSVATAQPSLHQPPLGRESISCVQCRANVDPPPLPRSVQREPGSQSFLEIPKLPGLLGWESCQCFYLSLRGLCGPGEDLFMDGDLFGPGPHLRHPCAAPPPSRLPGPAWWLLVNPSVGSQGSPGTWRRPSDVPSLLQLAWAGSPSQTQGEPYAGEEDLAINRAGISTPAGCLLGCSPAFHTQTQK